MVRVIALELTVIEINNSIGHGNNTGQFGFQVFWQRTHRYDAIFHN